MRSSSLAVVASFALALASAATVSGCRIEAHSQTTFTDDTQPAKTATKDWNGEPITIGNAGVNPLSGTGGVEVKFDASATKISATATFSAEADDDKRSDADASIHDAIATFSIDESNGGFNISCGHGGAHGTSGVAASGCKIIRVTIPVGSLTKAHNLTVSCGNGPISFAPSGFSEVPFVSKLVIQNNGTGEIGARVHPVANGSVTITGGDEVSVALPSDFSAKSVTFTTAGDDAAERNKKVITTDFPGMANGSPFPATPTADAITSLNVQSTGILSSDTVTITKL